MNADGSDLGIVAHHCDIAGRQPDKRTGNGISTRILGTDGYLLAGAKSGSRFNERDNGRT
jgi:hypothetical protein